MSITGRGVKVWQGGNSDGKDLLLQKDICIQRKYYRILKFDSSKKNKGGGGEGAGELQEEKLLMTPRLHRKFCNLVLFPGYYLLSRISPSFTNIP